MDGFKIIQSFFSRMRCSHCQSYLQADGIELIREDEGIYIVDITCMQCDEPMGVAMVGMELENTALALPEHLEELELTPWDKERFALTDPVSTDDVVDAHRFFTRLGPDWQKYLPPETAEWEIACEPESQAG